MRKLIARLFGKEPAPKGAAPAKGWHGSYLSEDELVADVLAKLKADPEGMKIWLDDASWHMPDLRPGAPVPSKNAGCLMFAPMGIRNHYGLWYPENPHTFAGGDGRDFEIIDGVITDPRHPDNLSGRVVDRVLDALKGESRK